MWFRCQKGKCFHDHGSSILILTLAPLFLSQPKLRQLLGRPRNLAPAQTPHIQACWCHAILYPVWHLPFSWLPQGCPSGLVQNLACCRLFWFRDLKVDSLLDTNWAALEILWRDFQEGRASGNLRESCAQELPFDIRDMAWCQDICLCRLADPHSASL